MLSQDKVNPKSESKAISATLDQLAIPSGKETSTSFQATAPHCCQSTSPDDNQTLKQALQLIKDSKAPRLQIKKLNSSREVTDRIVQMQIHQLSKNQDDYLITKVACVKPVFNQKKRKTFEED